MAITLTFTFATPADVVNFLNAQSGDDWPSVAGTTSEVSKPADEQPPWLADPDEPAASVPQTASNAGSADPWADDAATPAKPAQTGSGPHPEAGKLWPPDGSEYDKDTPNGNRHWKFGVAGAPSCDCGYPAAQVSGRKAGAKKDWVAYWCPIKFGKSYRDACKFSEFA